MKYLIKATSNTETEDDFKDVEILTEINGESSREDVSIIFELPYQRQWWIPITELDQLINIVNLLYPKVKEDYINLGKKEHASPKSLQ